jgi:glucose/mannose-6-phosphate isomerase
MMREIIYSLPNHISAAVGFVPDLSFRKRKYDKVLVCGMGGSGISGEILAGLYPQGLIVSNKDYMIPAWVDDRTLAIVVSYSGNTEETLNNYQQLARRKIDTLLLSSDGKLYAKKAPYKIRIPPGLPPRGAIGYLFTPLPIVLHQANLLKSDPRKDLLALSAFLVQKRDTIEKAAQRMARKFVGKLVIIYADSPAFAPVANRWRCQLNENAKMFAHYNVIPEMNHNEIVGLGSPEKFNSNTLLVFLGDPAAHRRDKIRCRLLKQLIKDEIPNLLDVDPQGGSVLQHVFWTIMLGDFISYYVALALGIDPMPVERIEKFKRELAKAGRTKN